MNNLFQNTYRISSARLQSWDYSNSGYYFVTICTKNKISYFGELKKEKMELNTMGEIVESFWKEIPKHFPHTKIAEFIVMPNHIHGIVIINENSIKDNRRDVAVLRLQSPNKDVAVQRLYKSNNNFMSRISPKSGSLGSIIRSFKSICTKTLRKYHPHFSWQSGFYDHIICEEKELENIQEYIVHNGAKHFSQKIIIKFE